MRNWRKPLLSYAVSAAQIAAGGSGPRRATAARTSPSWPGVISKATGRPQPSTTRGFWLCAPRGSARSPGFGPPFSACGGSVSLRGRRVDELGLPGSNLRQRQEQTSPDTLHRPSTEPIVNCGCRAVARRAILPSAAALQNVNNSAKNPPIIHPTSAGAVSWQKRIDSRPLLVAEPKFVGHDPCSVSKLES